MLAQDRKGKRAAFAKALSGALELGTVDSPDEVARIYRGSFGGAASDDAIAVVLSEVEADILAGSFTLPTTGITGGLFSAIQRWSRHFAELAPHAGLPEAERALLAELRMAVNSGDTSASLRRLGELIRLMRDRHAELVKARLLSKRSLLVSVLAFGVGLWPHIVAVWNKLLQWLQTWR